LVNPWLPQWICDFAKESSDFWRQFLYSGSFLTKTIDQQISRLVRAIPVAPAMVDLSLLPNYEELQGRQPHDQLVALLMRSVSQQAVTGKISADELRRWNETYSSWYATAADLELESVIQAYLTARNRSASAAWQWLANAPSQIYSRKSFVLGILIDGIILNTGETWPEEGTSCWLDILKKSSSLTAFPNRLRLCGQALRHCFANPQFPLGAIVSEVFSDVYSSLTTPESSFSEVLNFLNFLDWDKGKQLRSDLIDHFLNSVWAPGELAVAPKNEALLRKLIKRLMRNDQGHRYMQKMIKDLSPPRSPLHRKAKAQLMRISKNLDYREDWD
jgi:hypothetical protein